MEKLGAILTAAVAMAAVVVVGLFLFSEIRYVIRGKTTTGCVTSVTEEFARFANSDVEGMKPIYRYQCTYSFTADGTTYHGSVTTEAKGYSAGAPMRIQYITGTPSQHRVLTPLVQIYRVVFYAPLAVLTVLGVFAIARAWRARGISVSGLSFFLFGAAL